MSVKLMCVVPHGTISIRELNYNFDTLKTVKGFEIVNAFFNKHQIKHLLVVDPHDVIIKNNFNFYLSKKYEGAFSYRENILKGLHDGSDLINEELINLKNDNVSHTRELTHKIKWGSLVPLYYLNSSAHRTVNILSIDRRIDVNLIKEIGVKIFNLLNSVDENIAIVFSCDLSHTHSKTNPKFPYNLNSTKYDKHVFDILSSHAVENYNQVSIDIVNQARTDAHAQLTMLAGICENVEYLSQVFSYEVPSYFGMLTSIIEIK
jgi:aromatic ring-opening dioxygenase LigB subunit